ncbi:pumilio homolog 12-like [Dioscorea cayenensis subsp. rotundata]|uniref:Pumilio homolog 12-like n=1 Tax=Dioscorea cayennensis subsp. rotundata TaxID=55577 RepID=A0AB40CKL5_DIOCR|nr:pumilio homolog 12-like [Dioscorea cayenensis subsp. rotundata]XP_039140617.1 pumilio homolog 12-like [Dioscorea cayenensis subsp. rotundata]
MDMEGRRATEQEYDELEMLLGEIPNVTLANPHFVDHAITDILPKLGALSVEEEEERSSPSRKFTKSYNSPQASIHGGYKALNGSLSQTFDQHPQSNGNFSLKTSMVNTEKIPSDLPDNWHQASAFFGNAFLFDEGNTLFNKLSSSAVDHSPVSSLASPIGSMGVPNCSIPNTMINGVHVSCPELESHLALTRINGINKYVSRMDVQNESEFLKKKRQEVLQNNWQEQQRSIQVNSRFMPLNAETNAALELLPGVPFPGMELTASAFQQQYCFDVHSTACVPSHDSAWQNIEGGGHYNMHQQFFYPPCLHKQGFPNGTFSGIRSVGSTTEPYIKLPDSHQIQHFNGNLYWNDYLLYKRHNEPEFPAIGGGVYQCNPYVQKQTSTNEQTFLAKDDNDHLFMDRKLVSPIKILTRSDGMNSLRPSQSRSARVNQSKSTVDRDGDMHSNGQVEQPLAFSNGLWMDGLNCQSLSPSNHDFTISPKSPQVKYNSIDDVLGGIYSMAKDQIGCRFLQKKFAEGAPEDIERIFVEIIGHIVELMTDPFGNYLVQKLLEVCDEGQRMCILNIVTRKPGELFRISCDMHGTRAVQKVIETLQNADQYSMVVASLKPRVVALLKNINGNHVAQRCLQYLPAEYNEFLFDAAVAHCVELATDRQGCCVLQKCLYHSDGDRKARLMSEIASNSLFLSQDQYGNYVVQFILDQKVPWATSMILDRLEGNYADLSMQKCSSNVVEKCLRLAGEEHCVRIVQELMNSSMLLQILQDPFGNYVIQSALKECKTAFRASFVEVIKPHIPALRNSPYGRKVLSSICLKK